MRTLCKNKLCNFTYDEKAKKIYFTTSITGETLNFSVSGHPYAPVLYFENKDNSKSFSVEGKDWFPTKGISATEHDWQVFSFSCIGYVLLKELSKDIIYELPKSLDTYIETVNTTFNENFYIGHNRVNTGMFPPAGGLIINEYTLNKQGEKIGEWNDYSKNVKSITEDILYKIESLIKKD